MFCWRGRLKTVENLCSIACQAVAARAARTRGSPWEGDALVGWQHAGRRMIKRGRPARPTSLHLANAACLICISPIFDAYPRGALSHINTSSSSSSNSSNSSSSNTSKQYADGRGRKTEERERERERLPPFPSTDFLLSVYYYVPTNLSCSLSFDPPPPPPSSFFSLSLLLLLSLKLLKIAG